MLGYLDAPKGMKVSVRVTQWNRVSTATSGFEAGVKGPGAKECGLPIESGKGNKTDSPTEPPENNRAPQAS